MARSLEKVGKTIRSHNKKRSGRREPWHYFISLMLAILIFSNIFTLASPTSNTPLGVSVLSSALKYSSEAWPMPGGTPQHSEFARRIVNEGVPQLLWRWKKEGEQFLSPIIGYDGTIYLASHHMLYALNSNGTLKWKHQNRVGKSVRPEKPPYPSQTPQTPQIIVYKTKKIPRIDGKIESGEWDDAQPYYFEKMTDKYILKGTFKMTVAMKYDAENLYILVIANDDDYDDGDFVFFSIDYHPQGNPNWVWETTLLFYANNSVMNGTMTKCGSRPSSRIDAEIKTSYHRNIGEDYYIFEARVPMKYIPKDVCWIKIGYHDAHYKRYMHTHTRPYLWDLDAEFYMGNFSISLAYYTANETVEDIIEEHYPTENYMWIAALGVAVVAVVASTIAILRKKRRK